MAIALRTFRKRDRDDNRRGMTEREQWQMNSAIQHDDVSKGTEVYRLPVRNTAGRAKRPAGSGDATPQRSLRRWLREPMLHFIAAGALIFIATHGIAQWRDQSAKTIAVDAPLKARLAKLYALQLGAAPTDAQLAQLIDTYVHDEVLYREALALGLDKGDEIVRRRLVQKMGFLQNDTVIAQEPDDATLRSYYQSHLAEFAEPARIDFQQLYFSADRAGLELAQRRATEAVARLQAGAAPAAIGGDRSSLNERYQRLDRDGLTRLFGDAPIVDDLLRAAPGAWVGPVRSGYGWHVVRIERREESRVPAFEAVRGAVAESFRVWQKDENNRRAFQQLLAHYIVKTDRAQTGAEATR
jgi:hypothetical protein